MGSERKTKNSNEQKKSRRKERNDASLSDDYSDSSESETTTTTTLNDRSLTRRSSRRDVSTSSDRTSIDERSSRRRLKRGECLRHSEPRDKGKPPVSRISLVKRNDSTRHTIKVVNASGCKYVDLNYSIANTTAAKTNETMPPHTEKDHHSKKTHHSREKSIERKPSTKKSEKEKKKEKSAKDDKESSCKRDKDKPATPNCPLCTKPFKSPIILTCAHTFCKSCVTVLVEAGDGTCYQCPVCLSTSSLTGNDEELFCPNFIILQMLEKESSIDTYVCSVCDNANEAKHYCKECSDLLCNVCYDAHQVVKYTKDHSVSKLSSSVDLSKLIKKKYHCIKHENEKLGMYCNTCNESICRECAFTYHTGNQHKCILVEDAASLNRDAMKRRLFDIKSRTPKFQLMLLDIKRLKGLLRTQVKSVRAGISTSINTLINSLKEKEKELFKSADKIFADKLKKLKEQKDQLERELEKHEALGRMLLQLDKHDNDVEMLQMKEAITKSLEMLDKPPKTNIKFDRHTFLLRSNEVNLAKEIGKHGEIYCANKTTGEISLVEPDDEEEDTSRKRSAVGRLKKTAEGEDSIIMFSELEDGILPGSSDSSIFEGALQDMDVVKAKALKARANWLLLKSHLPGIVRYGKKTGRLMKDSKRRFFPETRSTVNKNTRNKAKKIKAKANWLLTRARLKQIVQQKHPPKPPTDYKSTPEKQSVLQILQSGTKYSKKLTRATAIKARARANWLLVRSRLSNIIAYGRITGVLPFRPQALPLTPLAYRRKREQKIMASIMHLRAIISRARANWLLVKSRLKDIAKYQKNPPKVNTKPTWRLYRQQLYNTRNHARQNIAESGSVRARANWLILKTLIPDIILFGKYQESFADTRQKVEEPSRYSKTTPYTADRILKNWDSLVDKTPERDSKRSGKNEKNANESLQHWDSLMNDLDKDNRNRKSERSPYGKDDKKLETLKNWDMVVKKNPNSLKDVDSYDNWDMILKKDSDSGKDKESQKNWDMILTKEPPSYKNLDSYKLWDLLISMTEGTRDKRSKTSFERMCSSQTDTETDTDHTNIQRKIDSFKNWDKLVSSVSSNNWETLISNTPCGDNVTDEYLNTTDEVEEYDNYKRPSEEKKPRSIPEIIQNWRILIGGTIVDKSSITKRVSFNQSNRSAISTAIGDWDRLIRGTVSDEALDNWGKLCDKKSETSNAGGPKGKHRGKTAELDNWDKLVDSTYDSKRSNSETQKSKAKTKNEQLDNWDKLLGNDAPKGKPRPKAIDLENWDKLVNTKYQDSQSESLNEGGFKRKPRPKSLDLENWDKLVNTKYSDNYGHNSDAPKRKPRAKSIDLENWDKLVNTKYSDRYDENVQKGKNRGKKSDLENWDKLVNTKYSDPPQGKRARTVDLENWDKLTNNKYNQNHFSDPKPETLNNWDRLIGTTMKNAKRLQKNTAKSDGLQGLQHWDKLMNGEEPEEDNHARNSLTSSARRKAYDNWYIITRCGELKAAAIKKWHNLQSHKGSDSNSECSDDDDNLAGKIDDKGRDDDGDDDYYEDVSSDEMKHVQSKAKAIKNWRKLIKGTIKHRTRKLSGSSSSSNKDKLKKRMKLKQQRTEKKKSKHSSTSTSVNDEDDENDYEEEDEEALRNWDTLLRGNNAYKDWDTLISGYIQKEEQETSSMSECVKYSPKYEKVQLGTLDEEDTDEKRVVQTDREQALVLWDRLVEGRIIRTDKDFEDVSYWKLLESTQSSLPSSSTTPTPVNQKASFKKSREKAKSNWKSLIKSHKQDSYEEYDNQVPPNVQTLFEKPPVQLTSEDSAPAPQPVVHAEPKKEFPDHDSQFLSMNVKTSKGDFQNVKLQLTSPDKSILSAHIAENGDGTFTIFCCPRIDDDFNMFVSLQGKAFKNDVQVLNLYGSFAGLKSRERELACKTINLIRWHLTPGLLRKKGDKIFPISTGLT